MIRDDEDEKIRDSEDETIHDDQYDTICNEKDDTIRNECVMNDRHGDRGSSRFDAFALR